MNYFRWTEIPHISHLTDPFTSTIHRIICHPTDTAILFVLIRNGGANAAQDLVLKYDARTQSYVTIGEAFTGGSVNDLFVVGESLYVAGGDFGLASREVTPKYLATRLISADNHAVWSPFPAPANQQMPTTVSQFHYAEVSGGSPIALAEDIPFWRKTDGTWSSDATDADLGVNLRGAGGTSPHISILSQSGEWLWAYATDIFELSSPPTSNIKVVRSRDGRTWEAVFANPTPTITLTDVITYDHISNGVYFMAYQNITGRHAVLFAQSGATTYTQVGESFTDLSGNNKDNTRLFRADNILYILSRQLEVFTEGGEISQFQARRRLDTGVSGIDITAGTSGSWGPALGGGITETSLWNDIEPFTPTSQTRFAVSSDQSTIFISTPGLSRAWNVAAYGLTALEHGKERYWPFGAPLRDGPTREIGDESYDFSVNAVNHYNNDDGETQTVIIGGVFRRINNVTLNSLAWANSDAPNTWYPFGNTGVSLPGSFVAPEGSGLTYEALGRVNTLVYMPDPDSRADARIVFVGGSFSQSGATPLNNIGRYYLKGSNAWTNMKGGVSSSSSSTAARVTALDYAGRKVFVGGEFTRAGNVSAQNIAMWDDERSEWSSLGLGVDALVQSILALSETDVWVAGNFQVASGVHVRGVARWDGSNWHAIECDSCSSLCEKGRPQDYYQCLTNDYGYELKLINNKITLLYGSGKMFTYDGKKFVVNANQVVSFGGGNQILSKAPEYYGSPNNVFATGSSSPVMPKPTRNNLMVVDLETSNYAVVTRGGFDNRVSFVSDAMGSSVPSLLLALFASVFLFAWL
jgi:hypothetical protein